MKKYHPFSSEAKGLKPKKHYSNQKKAEEEKEKQQEDEESGSAVALVSRWVVPGGERYVEWSPLGQGMVPWGLSAVTQGRTLERWAICGMGPCACFT